jgi:N-methylhydantoinase A
LRVVALGRLPEFRVKKRAARTQQALEAVGTREVHFEGRTVRAPIYARDLLPEGVEIRGPAIVEQMDSTIWVLPGYRAAADRYGNLIIRGKA